MASLFKKTTTRHVRPPGHPDAGRRCRSTDPGTVKTATESRKWYGRFRDAEGVVRTVPLAADKAAARSMLRELEVGADRGRAGLADPHADHAARPLADHLADFAAELRSRDRSEKHVRDTGVRCRVVLTEGCRFAFWRDVEAGRVGQYLADRRRAGMGAATSNHHLTACKMFARWAVRDGRIAADPLARLRPVNAATDVRKERRALEPGEFARLLDAAAAGPDRAGLPAACRVALYLAAGGTGLRASELASLTPGSFEFGADPPTVTVAAAYSKRRRRDVLPLHPELAARLRAYLAGRAAAGADPSAAVWGGRWAVKRAAAMVRGDLAEAGLPYADGLGRDFDFHALRGQFVTGLARAGVHPAEAQRLARHSDVRLTMNRYTRTTHREMAAAVGRLELPAPAAEAAGGSVTGGNAGRGTVAREPSAAARDDAAPAGTPAPDRPPPAEGAVGPARGGGLVAPMVALPGGDGRESTGTPGETSTAEHAAPTLPSLARRTPANVGQNLQKQTPRGGEHPGRLGEVVGGFEPPNDGFAIHCLRPLGYTTANCGAVGLSRRPSPALRVLRYATNARLRRTPRIPPRFGSYFRMHARSTRPGRLCRSRGQGFTGAAGATYTPRLTPLRRPSRPPMSAAAVLDAPDLTAPAGEKPETESQLVRTAQVAVSRCNWVVGRCAAEWTTRYARGRTDADFAALVGLSADQVFQRRRVWETFSDVRDRYDDDGAPTGGGGRRKGLRWSHFYVALTWDDAPECLDWAAENEATVAEMKAFRRALHGEDLSEPAARGPADDFAGDPSVIRLPTDPVAVRDVGGAPVERAPWDEDDPAPAGDRDRQDAPQALAALRETGPSADGEGPRDGGGDSYAPFSAGAVTPPGASGGGETEDKTASNADRLTKTLERLDATLTEAVLDSLPRLDDSRKGRLAESARALLGKLQLVAALD